MNQSRFAHHTPQRFVGILLLTVLSISSCMNPFSSNDRGNALAEAAPTPGAPEATTGTGTVHVRMGDTASADDPVTSVVETSAVETSAFGASNVGASAVGVSSIATSAVASSQVATDDIATFTVGLTSEDEPSMQVESVILESAGDAPPASAIFENVAAGRWTVSATGRAADGSIVIEGSRRGIVVEANATIDVSLVLFRIGSSAPADPAATDPAPADPPEPEPQPEPEPAPEPTPVAPAEPSYWEEQAADGLVAVQPDGGIVFLPDGYREDIGSSDITIDPVDGSVTHGGAGERRSTLSMPDTGSLELALSNVVLSGSGGWGIAFHGAESTTGQYGEFNGYTIQFDLGLGNRIVIRQWVDGRPQGVELTPFENVGADDYGIDLLRPMDVLLALDGPRLTLDITQDGMVSRVFDIVDVTLRASQPEVARTSGFVGLRTWSTAELTVERMVLTTHP